ncbi:MAG: hypothetical protein HZA24_07495 [Nitrospirae bacterium]|nr:hypothetical protein [Nitrospirota bacterium]
MRERQSASVQFLVGVLTKARLILIFMVLAVMWLIWTDRYTRGLLG